MRRWRNLPRLHLKLIFLISFSVLTYILLHRRRHLNLTKVTTTHFPSPITLNTPPTNPSPQTTTLSHLLFSIASSSSSLSRRTPYISLWYTPNTTLNTILFLDTLPSYPIPPLLPPISLPSPTSHFPYTFPRGHRSAIRIAYVVKDAVQLSLSKPNSNIHWFVFGDDDTIFLPGNVVSVLSKYDHRKMYYIGGVSETHEQNVKNSFEMGYGGGGFAISYPLGLALVKVLDSCLLRYPHFYGSDARISACVAELGVGLTREPGFHQFDVRGNVFGLLTAHPLSPLLSLHHMEIVESIFPRMNRTEALKHLFKAVQVDPGRILQQTVCYDQQSNMTVSVSWGYAVQIYEGNQPLPDMIRPQRTFTPWRRRSINTASQYVIDTRDYPRDPCKRPTVFYLEDVVFGSRISWTKYSRNATGSCDQAAVPNLRDIRVFAVKLPANTSQVVPPRRQCCDIRHPFNESMILAIRQCGSNELIAMHV